MTYHHALMQAIDNNDVNAFWNTIYHDPAFGHKDIAFDPEWSNGTGYYDGAVNAEIPELQVGEIGRSRSPAANNRRILIVKTQFGNVVVFERMTPAEDDTIKGPITINMPDLVRHSEMIGTEGSLSMEQLVDIFGNGVGPVYNVGIRLREFMSYAKQGGRLTRNLRFRRFEAMLVMFHNFTDIFKVMRNSPTRDEAIEALLKAPWEAPAVVREMHENYSIPFRSDGRGLSDKGLYRLTNRQAEMLMDVSLEDFLGQNYDIMLGQYCELASKLNAAAHKLSEDMEAHH